MSIELSQWMLDTMISMTLLMVFVLLIRKPVSHFFGAKIAYALWALPFARLFMPVLTLEAPTPVAVAEASPAGPTAFSELALIAPAEQVATSALVSIDWFLVALIIWAGGAGMLFISKLASYVQFREDIVSDGQLVGRHDNIRILETAAVGGPLAFGLFQKYIAVPTDFYRNYSPRERELALEHEIAHHESGDLAANFVGLLVLSLHWFNPVAWFAWVAFREDQETACDARILQNSGQEVKAIYGRTIAKSASGHQLGLASPLNQKNKIKGRLKMLGKGETTGFRKKLGMLMVGASTIVALPATATVVFVEPDVADAAAPLNDKVPSRSPVSAAKNGIEQPGLLGTSGTNVENSTSPSDPAWSESTSDGGEGQVINITMLNGSKDFANDKQYVHKIKHDGRTIILRTNKILSDSEAREMVEEAEESRLAAGADLREHEREMREHQKEMKEHEREMQLEMREVEREVEEAKREALKAVGGGWHYGPSGKLHRHGSKRDTAAQTRSAQRAVEREMRKVQREVERSVREAEKAAREAARTSSRTSYRQSNKTSRTTSRVWSISDQVAEISFAPRPPRPPKPAVRIDLPTAAQPDCAAMNKKIAMAGENGLSGAAWASVAGCGGFSVKVNKEALLKAALIGLEKGRQEARKCKGDKIERKEKIKDFDNRIAKVRAQLSMT